MSTETTTVTHERKSYAGEPWQHSGTRFGHIVDRFGHTVAEVPSSPHAGASDQHARHAKLIRSIPETAIAFNEAKKCLAEAVEMIEAILKRHPSEICPRRREDLDHWRLVTVTACIANAQPASDTLQMS